MQAIRPRLRTVAISSSKSGCSNGSPPENVMTPVPKSAKRLRRATIFAVGTGGEKSSYSLQYVHDRLQRRIGIMCAMIGCPVETAPPAIMRVSRILRVKDFQPRRSRKAVSGMRFLLLNHVRPAVWPKWASYAAILLGTLILGLDGIGRSLWLDEAWVANSVHQQTWGGMFYYPEWLQTTPPLFLLTARLLTHLIGFTTASLRVNSTLFALIAATAFLAVLRRVVAAPIALLGAVLLVFHPLPVEYFRAFKQYGGEMAATSVLLLAAVTYLQSPGRREFGSLVLSTLLLSLSYPLAFLFPRIVLAV